MKNTIVVLALLLCAKSFATEVPKASPSPTIPPPQIMKEEKPAGDKHRLSASEKIEKFSDLCVANKKTCIRKLKEVRATLTDSKENRVLIQKIDAILNKNK